MDEETWKSLSLSVCHICLGLWNADHCSECITVWFYWIGPVRIFKFQWNPFSNLKPYCIRCSHFKVDDVSALEAASTHCWRQRHCISIIAMYTMTLVTAWMPWRRNVGLLVPAGTSTRLDWIQCGFKTSFTKVHYQVWVPVKNGGFSFWILVYLIIRSIDGHEKIITWTFRWNRWRK
jgi:hypothetical protein